jgi:hypothetical protein
MDREKPARPGKGSENEKPTCCQPQLANLKVQTIGGEESSQAKHQQMGSQAAGSL